MICPNCKKESLNFSNCPYCNTPLVVPTSNDTIQDTTNTIIDDDTEVLEVLEPIKPLNNESLNKKLNYFYIAVIAVGSIVLIFLIINLFSKNNKKTNTVTTIKETKNITTYTVDNKLWTVKKPYGLGDEFDSSIISSDKNSYMVKVKGIRSLDINEINNILISNNDTYDLFDGFGLRGFVCTITLNDSNAGNLSNPILMGTYYNSDTIEDFVKINDENKRIEVKSYTSNSIKNGETKEVYVIYQTSIDNYSICLGSNHKDIGCIRP